ncbi:uncharacterized, partial [Tachysurus ichikawai]
PTCSTTMLTFDLFSAESEALQQQQHIMDRSHSEDRWTRGRTDC